MNKNGFTLIELLAVIVVLGIVMVIGVSTVLPLMDESREKAFRTDATGVIGAAETLEDLLSLNQLTIPTNSCDSGNIICFTYSDLVDSGYYKGNKETYTGTISINKTSGEYTLNLKKGAEFAIIGGTSKDYINDTGSLSLISEWQDSYETCTCS